MLSSLEQELNCKFDILVGTFPTNLINPSSAGLPEKRIISPTAFGQLVSSNLSPHACLLFYVHESEWNHCLPKYIELKRTFPSLDGCFIFARKARHSWKKWLNQLPYVHSFVKGSKNSLGHKLMNHLEVHRDYPRKGKFSQFNTASCISMTFWGEMSGAKCRVAMDTAASHSFVSANFVKNVAFKSKKSSPLSIELGNGTITSSSEIVKQKLAIQAFLGMHEFQVLDLCTDFDVILGNDWLVKHQAILDFPTQSVVVVKG